MPLGYVKGNTYCQNWDYDRYAALPVFKALCDLARENSLSLHFSFSNITRAYDCEVRRIHYFKESNSPYWIGCANRGGDTPLEALCDALRVALPVTPLLQVLCLEAECALLVMAVAKARETEAKIDKALDQLRAVLDTIMIGFLCGDEIVGEPAPLGTLRGKPFPEGYMAKLESRMAEWQAGWDRSKEIIPKADVARVIAPLTGGIPADPGEDDDL